MTDDLDCTELETLLEQERQFLLKGDLEGLATLLPMKELLVEGLLVEPKVNEDIIMPLKSKLKRNQLLLDGALDGIRAVATRLAALRQVRMALDTYDAQGRKQQVVTPIPSSVEKRA